MKKIFILFAAIVVISCYGLDEADYATMAEMTINNPDEVINANAGEEVVFDPQITSEKRLPITYEWYIRIYDKGASSLSDSTLVSTLPDIRHTWRRLGSYHLRLKADNGETTIFKNYTLNINSGLDEGIVILSKDAQDANSLVFVKTRTPQEIADDEQEIFPDVISLINPSCRITGATDLFMSYYKENDIDYCPLFILTGDEDGSIWVFDRRTFALSRQLKMSEIISPDVKPVSVAGEIKVSKTLGSYILGSDGNMYRLDYYIYHVVLKTGDLNITKTYQGRYKADYSPFFYNAANVYAFSSGRLYTYGIPETETVMNMAVVASGGSKIVAITKEKTDATKIYLRYGSVTFGSKSVTALTVDPTTVCMDADAQLVVNSVNTDAYYNFNDKIYRWNFLSGVTFPSAAVITPPAGETIRLLNVNHERDKLYVLTYNATRSGKKGSLYIYKFSDHTLDKKYEGICDEPVAIRYKEKV
jgi:hypothetical protein